MNTKLLERLSKAAGSNFLEIERDKDTGEIIGIYVYRKGTMRKVMRIGGIDEDRLFGAICERIETEGWTWSIVRGTCEDYTFRIYAPPSVQIGDPSISGESWEAAALALCEALEGKQQEVTQ